MKDRIYVYDLFTEIKENNPYKLNPEELYLYCYLYKNRGYDHLVNMSVDTIHYSVPIRFHKSVDAENRKRIKQNLSSLKNKKVIHFDTDEILFETKKGNSVSLVIRFEKMGDNCGYYQLTYSDFDSAKNINHLFIRLAVERFNDVKTASPFGGRWISEKEFADLMGVSKRQFRNYVDDMIELGILYKMSGERKENSKLQDKNIYKTVPFGFEGEEENTKVVVYKVPKNIKYPVDYEIKTTRGDYTVSELKELFEVSAWGRRNDNPLSSHINYWTVLEYDDYELYRIAKDFRIDRNFVMRCEKIIRVKSEGHQYDGQFELWEEKYCEEKMELENEQI